MLFNFQIVGGKVKSVAFSVRGGEGEKKINTLLPSLIKTVLKTDLFSHKFF